MPRKANKASQVTHTHNHPSHPKTLSRLRIAAGHLNKVVAMVEQNDDCLPVLQQLSAVISALQSSRVTLIQDHFNACVAPELPENSKYLLEELETILERALK